MEEDNVARRRAIELVQEYKARASNKPAHPAPKDDNQQVDTSPDTESLLTTILQASRFKILISMLKQKLNYLTKRNSI